MAESETTVSIDLQVNGQQEAEKGAQRVAWNRPRLERLQLSMDTAASKGSFTDGILFTTV